MKKRVLICVLLLSLSAILFYCSFLDFKTIFAKGDPCFECDKPSTSISISFQTPVCEEHAEEDLRIAKSAGIKADPVFNPLFCGIACLVLAPALFFLMIIIAELPKTHFAKLQSIVVIVLFIMIIASIIASLIFSFMSFDSDSSSKELKTFTCGDCGKEFKAYKGGLCSSCRQYLSDLQDVVDMYS